MILAFFVIVPFLVTAQSPPTVPTYYVDDDYQGSDPNWFNNIQDAIDQSNMSNIMVYPGTYHENLLISYKVFYNDDGTTTTIRKQISLVSVEGPENTIIDGDQNGAVVKFYGAGPGCEIEGFTIRNGTGEVYDTPSCGGGIYCVSTSVLIKNNVIRDNHVVQEGGGIYCEYNSDESSGPFQPVIENNTISWNSAGVRGGGISCYAIQDLVTIRFNDISRNTAGSAGGGIHIRGNSDAAGKIISLVERNSIHANHTTGTGSGAGIGIADYGINQIFHNHIYSNTSALKGGGIYLGWKANFVDQDRIDRNRIHDNTAQDSGGGIYIDENNAILTNNVIRANTASTFDGGGLYIAWNGTTQNQNPQLTNNSLSENEASNGSGGGIFVECLNGTVPRIENTIIYGNTAAPGKVNELDYDAQISQPPIVTYCDVEDKFNKNTPWGSPGNTTNIWANPLFTDLKLHIAYDPPNNLISPCKEKGNNTATNLPVTDFDGENRIYPIGTGIVDIGSDEIPN